MRNDVTGATCYYLSKSKLNTEQELEVFEILKRKAKDELKIFYKELKINDDSSKAMLDLIDLHGDPSVLDDALRVLKKSFPDVKKYLDEVKALTDSISDNSDLSINIDLSELRGYNYHTGMIYTAFVPNEGKGIAFGGRYDDIGSAFGRAGPVGAVGHCGVGVEVPWGGRVIGLRKGEGRGGLWTIIHAARVSNAGPCTKRYAEMTKWKLPGPQGRDNGDNITDRRPAHARRRRSSSSQSSHKPSKAEDWIR